MQDEKPSNKTNYTQHQNGSVPKEIANSLWWEKEKTRGLDMKEKCPSDKEYQCELLEHPTQYAGLRLKDCLQE